MKGWIQIFIGFIVWLFVVHMITSCALINMNVKTSSVKDEIIILDCQILVEKGQLEQAEAACDMCLAYDDKNSDCLNAMGVVIYARDATKASELFSKAIRYDKKNYVAYNNLGSYYAMSNNLKDAGDNFKKAHEINPEYFDALFNHAYVLITMGRLDRALVLLNRAKLVAGDRDISVLDNLRNKIFELKKGQ